MAGRAIESARGRSEQGAVLGADSSAPAVRQARFADLWALRLLQRRCFEGGQAYGLPTLALLQSWPRAIILIATVGDEPVGSIVADLHEGQGRILNLCVAPPFRRRGIGAQLMRLAEEILPTEHLTLMVEDKNLGAQALYRSLGYHPVGDLRNYYGRNRHGILMEKRPGQTTG